MKILAVECDDGRFFIKEETSNTWNHNLRGLLVNGKQLEDSFCENWYIVKGRAYYITYI